MLPSKLWPGEVMGKPGDDQTKKMPVALGLPERSDLKTEGWTKVEIQRGWERMREMDTQNILTHKDKI